MKKVFFGGLKNHWKDYILVLICGIFMVTIIFLSNSLSDCLQWIIDGQTTGNAEESYTIQRVWSCWYIQKNRRKSKWKVDYKS